jgi:cobalt-zinc-cadmium efflux system protein
LAAPFNAVFLLVSVGAIGWEAVTRLVQPEPVAGKVVMAVAAAGILVNGITAWLFASGRKGDLNIRSAFLHMAADAAISAGVVAAGLLILFTGWLWLDPVASLIIAAIIIWGTWGLLRDSVAMSLDAVPANVDPAAVQRWLLARSGVSDIHDLHIWPMSTTEIALTAHLVMSEGCPSDDFLFTTAQELRKHHGIAHVTLQIETQGSGCPLAPAHVV